MSVRSSCNITSLVQLRQCTRQVALLLQFFTSSVHPGEIRYSWSKLQVYRENRGVVLNEMVYNGELFIGMPPPEKLPVTFKTSSLISVTYVADLIISRDVSPWPWCVNPILGTCQILKSPGTHPGHVFAGRSDGTAICEHLRSWLRRFWNERRLAYLGHSCPLWPSSCLEEPHQWWGGALHLRSLLGIASSVPFLTGEKVTSEAREVRLNIGGDLFPVATCTFFFFFQLKCITWVSGRNNVSGNDT